MGENACSRLRRLRASLDTGEKESEKLPAKGMSIYVVEQRRRGRQDAGSADQSGTEPQDDGKESTGVRICSLDTWRLD